MKPSTRQVLRRLFARLFICPFLSHDGKIEGVLGRTTWTVQMWVYKCRRCGALQREFLPDDPGPRPRDFPWRF